MVCLGVLGTNISARSLADPSLVCVSRSQTFQQAKKRLCRDANREALLDQVFISTVNKFLTDFLRRVRGLNWPALLAGKRSSRSSGRLLTGLLKGSQEGCELLVEQR